MNKQQIIVLQGVPASGKSTWAGEFVANKNNWIIVSRDSIRESTGKYWVPSRENYISEVEEFQVKNAIKNKLNVIIDATNLNPKTIEKWKNLALELNCKIDFKLFKIDFKTALDRDSNRSRTVGKKVLESFFSRYFPEELKEYYTDNRNFLEYNPNKQDCVICDLDGTLAIHQGRSPYDLTKISSDKVNSQLLTLLKTLNRTYPIIFLSGREGTEQCTNDTLSWLIDAMKDFDGVGFKLLMRNKGDYRPDEIIKKEIFEREISLKYNVICVFDDRDKVVKMWRDLGILCNQVYYGDF